MYADFFGLRELPFNNTPDPRFFYSTPDHEEALASLIYAVQQRKGFVLLTGEVGAGKTLVSRMMLRHFNGSVEFATINHAVESAADLLEAVCTELELPFESGSSNTQLVRQLHDFLLAKFAQNVPVVLVLDEAQNLPVPAFEQLRMIGNLESDDAKLLQICIVGQPELQTIIQSPQVRQLKQRIFRSFHLPALDQESCRKYIQHRLTVAGASDPAVFTDSAIDQIFQYSRGLPRLINAVCDNAMLSGYSAGKRAIDESIVAAVIKQMMLSDDPPAAGGAGNSYEGHRGQHGPDPCRGQPGRQPMYPYAAPQPPARAATVAGSYESPWSAAAYRPAISPLDAMHERVRSIENEIDRLRAQVGRAEAAYGNLHHATHCAESLLVRVQGESGELQTRERKLRDLGSAVKTTAAELNRLLVRLQDAVAQSRKSQSRAQAIDASLARQIERAANVADILSASGREQPALDPGDCPSARVVRDVRVSAAGIPRPGAGHIEPLLKDTRSAISELRGLGSAGAPIGAELGQVDRLGNRLAEQAETLLSILDRDSAS